MNFNPPTAQVLNKHAVILTIFHLFYNKYEVNTKK